MYFVLPEFLTNIFYSIIAVQIAFFFISKMENMKKLEESESQKIYAGEREKNRIILKG